MKAMIEVSKIPAISKLANFLPSNMTHMELSKSSFDFVVCNYKTRWGSIEKKTHKAYFKSLLISLLFYILENQNFS